MGKLKKLNLFGVCVGVASGGQGNARVLVKVRPRDGMSEERMGNAEKLKKLTDGSVTTGGC